MKQITPETKEDRILRLGQSYSLLFESMLKFGCYTKCHDQLFKRIKDQLREDGIVFECGDAP